MKPLTENSKSIWHHRHLWESGLCNYFSSKGPWKRLVLRIRPFFSFVRYEKVRRSCLFPVHIENSIGSICIAKESVFMRLLPNRMQRRPVGRGGARRGPGHPLGDRSIRRHSIRRVQFVAFFSSHIISSPIHFVALSISRTTVRRIQFVARFSCRRFLSPEERCRWWHR